MVDQVQTVDNVTVKSGWFSKINWTQGVAMFAMIVAMATGGKFNIDPQQQVSIVVTIGILSGLVTWVWRTWFNDTVSPAAVKK